MLLLLSGGSARVVQDFQNECGAFFYHNIPPTVLLAPRFRQICQTLYNQPYFATLYDTYNKIPVYSAYVFIGGDCERVSSGKWYIEPQLEYLNPNMAQRKIPLNNQASNSDYQRSGFDRGHLAPVSLANSQGCANATFTLTNAAPQNPSFNRGQWKGVERNLKETLSKCTMPAYIVTGVVPGSETIKNRVMVPSHFWTAYCCQSTGRLISGAVYGINSHENKPPVKRTVREIEIDLKKIYRVDFRLFHNNCKSAS